MQLILICVVYTLFRNLSINSCLFEPERRCSEANMGHLVVLSVPAMPIVPSDYLDALFLVLFSITSLV
jgi:hypothetical protein